MPEGDTLHRAARRLQPLVGQRVEAESPHPRAQAERVAERLDGRRLESVEAIGSYYLNERIADVTTTHLSFPGGARAQVFVSWLHPFKEQKLVVVGSEGMAVFDDGEPAERKLVVFPHRIDWHDGFPSPHKAEPIPVEIEKGEPLRAECQHFLDCVETGATPRTDGREGLRVLTVLTRASASLRGAAWAPGRIAE